MKKKKEKWWYIKGSDQNDTHAHKYICIQAAGYVYIVCGASSSFGPFVVLCFSAVFVVDVDVVVLFLFIALAFICFECRFILLHLDRFLFFSLGSLNELYDLYKYVNIYIISCLRLALYLTVREKERKKRDQKHFAIK